MKKLSLCILFMGGAYVRRVFYRRQSGYSGRNSVG